MHSHTQSINSLSNSLPILTRCSGSLSHSLLQSFGDLKVPTRFTNVRGADAIDVSQGQQLAAAGLEEKLDGLQVTL